MMKNNKYIIAVIGFALSLQASAKIYDRLILKDGSVVEGYISAQVPGKTISFTAERTYIVLPQEAIQDVADRQVKVSSLSAKWVAWTCDNTQYVNHVNGTDFLTQSKLLLKDNWEDTDSIASEGLEPTPLQKELLQHIDDHMVCITERGQVYRYVDIASSDYTFNVSDIARIERLERDENETTGLVDIVETRDGKTFKGQITSQTPGKSIHMLLDNRNIEIIKYSNIARQRKEGLNSDQDIVEQTPLLDVVTTSGLDKKEVSGVIVLQDYGTVNKGSYLIVHTLSDTDETIAIKDISRLGRIQNEKWYKPRKNLPILSPTDVYVCQQNVEPVINPRKQKNGMYVISADAAENHVVFNGDNIAGRLIVEMLNTPENHSVILIPVLQNKYGDYTFTSDYLIKEEIFPEKTSKDSRGVLRKEYIILNDQTYVLFHRKDETIRLIEVR